MKQHSIVSSYPLQVRHLTSVSICILEKQKKTKGMSKKEQNRTNQKFNKKLSDICLFCLLYSCLIESVTRKDRTKFIHFSLQAFANAASNK
jgi:hypothetical protein